MPTSTLAKLDTGSVELSPGNPELLAALGGPMYGRGITWNFTVNSNSLPPQLVPAGDGMWGAAQIFTPIAWAMINGVLEPDLNNGLTNGLDAQFPYLGDTFAADNNAHNDGDSPNISLIAEFTKVIINPYTFSTYLLYQPTDGGSGIPPTWVPLHLLTWVMSGIATLTGGVWTSPPNPVTATDGGAITVLPSWTLVITPNNFVGQ
jgi:hypothetical protein